MSPIATVIVGTLVFVLGQIVVKFFLEPIRAQKVILADIAFALIYTGNIGPMHGHDVTQLALVESHLDVTKRTRGLAARMTASLAEVPLYPLWSSLGFVKSRATVDDAIRILVWWSNAVHNGPTDAARTELAACLKLVVRGTEPAVSVRKEPSSFHVA